MKYKLKYLNLKRLIKGGYNIDVDEIAKRFPHVRLDPYQVGNTAIEALEKTATTGLQAATTGLQAATTGLKVVGRAPLNMFLKQEHKPNIPLHPPCKGGVWEEETCDFREENKNDLKQVLNNIKAILEHEEIDIKGLIKYLDYFTKERGFFSWVTGQMWKQKGRNTVQEDNEKLLEPLKKAYVNAIIKYLNLEDENEEVTNYLIRVKENKTLEDYESYRWPDWQKEELFWYDFFGDLRNKLYKLNCERELCFY